MFRSVPRQTWQEKLEKMARLKGIECREMLESDLPACRRIARLSFPENLSDLLTGTHGLVLVKRGDVIGYIIIDEQSRLRDLVGSRAIVGEVTDAAVLRAYRHWAALLFLRASKYLAARGGIWMAECLPETTYRFLRGAERRGFITIHEDIPVVFRGSAMRRLYFTVNQPRPDQGLDMR